MDRGSIRKAPITTAIFLALASTFGFGAGFVLTQFGLRWMPPWLGAAISIPTSTLLFWCLAPFFVDPSDGNLKAVALFAGVGLFFPGTVALLNFESNRLMGPNIDVRLLAQFRPPSLIHDAPGRCASVRWRP